MVDGDIGWLRAFRKNTNFRKNAGFRCCNETINVILYNVIVCEQFNQTAACLKMSKCVKIGFSAIPRFSPAHIESAVEKSIAYEKYVVFLHSAVYETSPDFYFYFWRNYLMTITKTQEGAKLTIAIEGELNTNTAPDLEKEFETCLDGITSLVIDAQKMNYISSAGLRALFGAAEVMQENGDMCVINANDEVRNIFEITGFVDIIDVK